MSVLFSLASAFLLYSVYTYAGYSAQIRNSSYFFALGLACVTIAHLLWMSMIRALPSGREIFVVGLQWDALITVSSVAVPLLLGQLKVDHWLLLATALIVSGIFILKVFCQAST